MRASNPALGVVLIAASVLAFAVQDAIVKALTVRYPVIELLMMRIVLVSLIIACAAALVHGRDAFVTRAWRPMCVRGVLAFTAFYVYYIGLSVLPLGDAATVFMTAPLFVTLLSVPLLGERVGLPRWLAVGVGFVAVIVMLDPGAALFSPVAALPLVSALCYALIPIITRSIDSEEQPLTINLYTVLAYTVVSALFSAGVWWFPAEPGATAVWATLAAPWRWPSMIDAGAIAGTAILMSVGLYGITRAYRLADVSILAPLEYSYLVWAMALGVLAFGDVPTPRTLIAAVVIATCGIVIAWRERRQPAGRVASPG